MNIVNIHPLKSAENRLVMGLHYLENRDPPEMEAGLMQLNIALGKIQDLLNEFRPNSDEQEP